MLREPRRWGKDAPEAASAKSPMARPKKALEGSSCLATCLCHSDSHQCCLASLPPGRMAPKLLSGACPPTRATTQKTGHNHTKNHCCTSEIHVQQGAPCFLCQPSWCCTRPSPLHPRLPPRGRRTQDPAEPRVTEMARGSTHRGCAVQGWGGAGHGRPRWAVGGGALEAPCQVTPM